MANSGESVVHSRRAFIAAAAGVATGGTFLAAEPARADPVYVTQTYLDPGVVVATPERFSGIDPTGTTSSVGGIQAALAATPNGGTLIMPQGTYRIDGTISVVSKTLTLSCYGATFMKTADATVFSFSQPLGATQNITGVTSTTFQTVSSDHSTTTVIPATQATLSAPPPAGWRRGAFVKIVADDYVVGSRSPTSSPNGDLKSQARVGQIMEIKDVSGATVVLDGSLRKPFTTNIRAALIPECTVRLLGATFDTTDALMANGNAGSGLINFTSLVSPLVQHIRVLRQTGPNVQFKNCLNPLYRDSVIGWSANDPSPSQGNAYRLGYGVIVVNCHGGATTGNQFFDVRHAFTDDVARIDSNTAELSNYGWPYAHVFESNLIQGSTAAAVSPHHGGDSHQFIDNTIITCFEGYNLRGTYHSVSGGRVREVMTLFGLTSENGGASYGHKYMGVVADAVDQVFSLAGTNVDSSNNPIRETVICEISDNRVSGIRLRVGGNQRMNARFARNYFQLGATFTGTGYQSLISSQDSRLTWDGDTIDTIDSPLNGAVAARPLFDFISAVSSECYGTAKLRNSGATQQFTTVATRSGSSTGTKFVMRLTVAYGWGAGYLDYIPTSLGAGSSLWMEGEENSFSNALISPTASDVATSTLGTKIGLVRQPIIQLRVDALGTDYTVSSAGWGTFATDPQRIAFYNVGTSGNITIAASNAAFILTGSVDLVITPGKCVEFVATNGKLKQLTAPI